MPDIVVTLSAIITVIVFLLGVFGTTIRLWDKVGFVAIFIAILWGAMLALRGYQKISVVKCGRR